MEEDRVQATPAALEVIERLAAEHGPLVFLQSGGCCDGSSPMCVRKADLPIGPGDVLLGDVGPASFYVDRELDERWGRPRVRHRCVARGGRHVLAGGSRGPPFRPRRLNLGVRRRATGSLRPTALRLGERPEVEGVQVDHVDAVRGEGAGDLRPVLDRVVDRLGYDGRSRPDVRARLRIAGRPVRQRGLCAEPGVVPGAACGEARQFSDRGRRLAWSTRGRPSRRAA